MGITDLLEPIVGDGIRSTNFFNGRVLTAEDLRAEQRAARDHRRQLALAVGDGVVRGLHVQLRPGDDAPPVLDVSAGLAINREGDAVALAGDAAVRLERAAETVAASDAAFVVCERTAALATPAETGLHVLTIRPASAPDGRAPMVELGSDGVAGACGSRYTVDGARLALVPVPPDPTAAAGTLAALLAADLASLDADLDLLARGTAPPSVAAAVPRLVSRVRSAAAYLCFGAPDAAAGLALPFWPADPGSADGARLLREGARLGAVDALRAGGALSDAEVPLALLLVTRRGVEFVDAWAVRRPAVPLGAPGATWAPLGGARPPADAVAMLLQFQQHVADLAAGSLAALATVSAVDHFRVLPPAGVLPLAVGGARGVTVSSFFSGRAVAGTHAPPGAVFVEGARVGALIRRALELAPTPLAEGDAVRVYVVREGADPRAPAGAAGRRPYLVFTSGHLPPYFGEAYFDASRWDYANYPQAYA